MSTQDKCAWTQVFLDYPPRFLGVIGMLASAAGLRNGKPTQSETWVREAEVFSAAGYSAMLYAYVRERIPRSEGFDRRLNQQDWLILPQALAAGVRLTVVVDAIAREGRVGAERELERARREKRLREITARVTEEMNRLDNLES